MNLRVGGDNLICLMIGRLAESWKKAFRGIGHKCRCSECIYYIDKKIYSCKFEYSSKCQMH